MIIIILINMDINIIKLIDKNLKIYESIDLCFTNLKNKNINNITKIKDFNKLDKYLCDTMKMKKKDIYIKRDYYYSQIRDYNIKTKDIKVYTKDFILLDEFVSEINNICIFNTEIIKNDLESFPNLNLYHFSNNIDIISYELNNILINIENLNVFIQVKKNYDKKFLENLIKYLQSCL